MSRDKGHTGLGFTNGGEACGKGWDGRYPMERTEGGQAAVEGGCQWGEEGKGGSTEECTERECCWVAHVFSIGGQAAVPQQGGSVCVCWSSSTTSESVVSREVQALVLYLMLPDAAVRCLLSAVSSTKY